MIVTAGPAPKRRWFYTTYIAMRSAELGVHHVAIHAAMGTGELVRAWIRLRATRLDACREPVALILHSQPRSYATYVFEKDHDTGFLHWVGRRQAYVCRLHPMWALPPATRPSDKTRPGADTRTTGLYCDMTAEIRVGTRLVYLTIEVLTRRARRQYGQCMRGIGDSAAWWSWIRRWLARDEN
jgi:hypothetical protein